MHEKGGMAREMWGRTTSLSRVLRVSGGSAPRIQITQAGTLPATIAEIHRRLLR